MIIFIARDGDMIGEYPHSQLEAMARAGRVRPEDDYWHEGMGEWSTLGEFLRPQAWEPVVEEEAVLPPPPSGPAIDRRVLIGGGAALLGLIALIAFLVVKPDANDAAVERTIELNGPSASEIRDRAVGALKKRIERLPDAAKAPVNTFYYDLKVDMRKTFLRDKPWAAILHGFENVVDPKTGITASRTEFTLRAEYRSGEWVFQNYRATVYDLLTGAETDVEEGESSNTPPSIVGALGLRLQGVKMKPPPIIPRSEPVGSEDGAPQSQPPPLTIGTPRN